MEHQRGLSRAAATRTEDPHEAELRNLEARVQDIRRATNLSKEEKIRQTRAIYSRRKRIRQNQRIDEMEEQCHRLRADNARLRNNIGLLEPLLAHAQREVAVVEELSATRRLQQEQEGRRQASLPTRVHSFVPVASGLPNASDLSLNTTNLPFLAALLNPSRPAVQLPPFDYLRATGRAGLTPTQPRAAANLDSYAAALLAASHHRPLQRPFHDSQLAAASLATLPMQGPSIGPLGMAAVQLQQSRINPSTAMQAASLLSTQTSPPQAAVAAASRQQAQNQNQDPSIAEALLSLLSRPPPSR